MVASVPYRRTAKRVDWYLILAALIVCACGVLALYSVAETGTTANFKKHLMWLVAGGVGAAIFAFVNPEFWIRRSLWLYLFNLAMLAAVLVAGQDAGGAQRWIDIGPFQFQPSELSKLLLIISLAALLTKRLESASTTKTFLLSFIHVAVPAAMVFKQPDLGTALVLIGIWIGMVLVAGATLRHVVTWVVVVSVLFVFAWEAGVIKDYQKSRVVAFLDPAADPQGAGYQVSQGRMAIGSGGLLGKGFGHGIQKEGRWIPAQHTDFVYTVIAEEGGFVGSSMLVLIFAFLLYRIWRVLADTANPTYRLLAVGVFCLWSYHIVVNLAMVLGLFPVVGVPLPLISYGGTATIVTLSSLGLILGIRAREEKIVF